MGRFTKPPKARKPRPRVVIPQKPTKPVKAQPKKPKKPVKTPLKAPPKKPRKPVKAPPKKPTKAKPVKYSPKKGLRPKPRKPKAPPKPPKQWITQIFGKNRREKIRPLTDEDRERIKEAEDDIKEAERQARKHKEPFGATELSPVGYEWFELIAAMEKMSPHDVYTLFMSPK